MNHFVALMILGIFKTNSFYLFYIDPNTNIKVLNIVFGSYAMIQNI